MLNLDRAIIFVDSAFHSAILLYGGSGSWPALQPSRRKRWAPTPRMPRIVESINQKFDPLLLGELTGSEYELVELATGVKRQFLLWARDSSLSTATDDSSGRRSDVRERSHVLCAAGSI